MKHLYRLPAMAAVAVLSLGVAALAQETSNEQLPDAITDRSLLPDWIPPPPPPSDQVAPRPSPASYQHLVGQTIQGRFEIAGWEDWGGGLLADPVWFGDYHRADEARLVLVLWSLPAPPGAVDATFQITDVLEVPPVPRGYELAFFCRGPQPNITRSIVAVARTDRTAEDLRDLRQAWAIDHLTGRVAPISPAGLVCANESWGE